MTTFISRLLLLSLALFPLSPVVGQNHPAKERGFKPEYVYDLNGFDTVNTVNANLSAQIPFGAPYPVGEGLSYQFVRETTPICA